METGLMELNLPPQKFGGNVSIMYWQGPIVKPDALPADVAQLAYFRTEIHSNHENETKGEMVDTPAITSLDGYTGDVEGLAAGPGGRVVLNSPHRRSRSRRSRKSTQESWTGCCGGGSIGSSRTIRAQRVARRR